MMGSGHFLQLFIGVFEIILFVLAPAIGISMLIRAFSHTLD